MKDLLILGASGSIGTQTLDIVRENPNDFRVVGVSVGKNFLALENLIKEFPTIKYAYVISPHIASSLSVTYPNISFYHSEEGLSHLVLDCDVDMVVNALVGFAGLAPTVNALLKNEIVALANKESLVVGGELINSILKNGKGKIYPIDSEHAALLKCINKVNKENVSKLIITASGGAFRDFSREEIINKPASEALKHPNWKMGEKITVDCATMMNKGFEVLEAYYLFNFKIDDIEVLMHKESMVHSLIRLNDGTYVAEISKPDMHNPIRYALYETNIDYDVYYASDYKKYCNGGYHFSNFDENRYPCVKFALDALKSGGLTCCVLNATNEEAVYAYLRGDIKFFDIEDLIKKYISDPKFNKDNNPNLTLDDYINCDQLIRILVREEISKMKKGE